MNTNIRKTLDEAIKEMCDWNITDEEMKLIIEYFTLTFKDEHEKSKKRI